jgi:hypothetical protein
MSPDISEWPVAAASRPFLPICPGMMCAHPRGTVFRYLSRQGYSCTRRGASPGRPSIRLPLVPQINSTILQPHSSHTVLEPRRARVLG